MLQASDGSQGASACHGRSLNGWNRNETPERSTGTPSAPGSAASSTPGEALGLSVRTRRGEVLSLYTTPQEFIARRQSKGVMVLMALAATLVGLSLLLVIGYNWSQMPDSAKVTAVFGSLIVTHAAGAGLRWRKGLRRESEILFFIGCIIYGSGIWLLAQILTSVPRTPVASGGGHSACCRSL